MNDKERVAEHAANLVERGMVVGLGTGSTANCFIDALARRNAAETLGVSVVSSSVVSAIKAREAGLPLQGIEQIERLDLYVDGADEVADDLSLLKGRGYDLVREKLLGRAADRFIVLVDRSKLVARIGERYPIPVEVMPFAWRIVKRRLESLGGVGGLRPNSAKDGLAITSHGSLVLDMTFAGQPDSRELDSLLSGTPGVVEHGIFFGLAGLLLIGADGQVETRVPRNA